MRASLFLSALFVATLVGGTAAAERPDTNDSRPRVTSARTREVSADKGYARANTDRNDGAKVEKAQSYRYQGKESMVSTSQRASKADMVGKLPKQAMERVRCSGAGEDCGSSKSARKTSQQNSDRGTKTAKGPAQVNERGKAGAPSASERALLKKLLSARCAQGGCTSDVSDSY